MSEEPGWWKILNIDAENFERSRYAGPSHGPQGKFRIKDIAILRKIAPEIYAAAAQEVEEHSKIMLEHRGMLKKYTLGRKLGSIPMVDMALNPELANDPKAQDRYFQRHPELKVKG